MSLLKIQEPQKNSDSSRQNQSSVIGIDLGTTNSLVGIIKNNKVRFFADENGRELHKSVVAFDKAGNIVAVGNKAYEENYTHKISSIKRLMGKGCDDVKNLHDKFDFKFDESASNKGELKIIIGEEKYSPTEISAEILRYLKNLALENIGHNTDTTTLQAVVTVPAYFDEAAKNATKLAAKLAGLEILRLVNEPTAAALAYGLDNAAEGIYAVYDLGGGTFDVSILKMQKGVFKVLGVSGDNALGGDDFDDLLATEIAKNFAAPRKAELKNIAQKIKEELSVKESVGIMAVGTALGSHLRNATSDILFTRENFEKLITPKINRTIELAKNLLDDLNLQGLDIKGVIMVGGSSRIPLIHYKLSEIFDKAQIFTNLDPDRVVASGAAWQAYNLSGNSQNLLLDVTPLSLGVEMMGGIVDKIIERNTTIPVAMAKEFTTYTDNQTGLKLHIVQGEREFAKDCRSLAQFEIKNIPPMRAGLARVLVTFKVDADGLLTVSAEEKITGQKQEIIVKPSYGIDEGQIKNMLLDSMRNAKQDMAQRLEAEAIREAKQNLIFLKRDLEEYGNLVDKKEKTAIEKDIKNLENALESRLTREKIIAVQKQLEKTSENFVLQKMNKSLEYYVSKKIDEI